MIVRDFASATGREFDFVIVGGGIYGASLLQEAVRRGRSACLCEASDFGGGTSWNSLRIVHGGLRYLQSMHLRRFFQSVSARRRVARQFPTLIRPLQCLMPLYGQGLKRASVMRAALRVNDSLSSRRNEKVRESLRLPAGGVLDAEETRNQFALVRQAGLQGAAYWTDYFMVSSERIIIEMLRDACRAGAVALNYAPVIDVVSEERLVRGVRVRDRVSGAEQSIRGRIVLNCTGPRLRDLARGRGGDAERLFRPSLAFNILLDRALPTSHALAVASPEPGAPFLFVVPQQESVLVGTRHLPRPANTIEAVPTESEIVELLTMLNAALPGLDARIQDVRRVFAGLLPATAIGTADLVKRELIEDHGSKGGLRGFYSVSGVKFTTANVVAGRILDRISGVPSQAGDDVAEVPLSPASSVATDSGSLETLDAESFDSAILRIVDEEAVQCPDDLILRRTNWATTLADIGPLRERVSQLIALRRSISRDSLCA